MTLRTQLGRALHKIAQRLAPDYFYEHSILPSLPWAFVQTAVERELPRLIPSIASRPVWNVVDVGAHTGEEIIQLKRRNPSRVINAWLYEANPEFAAVCRRRFANDSTVNVIGKAVGDRLGTSMFYETSIVGSGSVLPLARSDLTASQQIRNTSQFEVEMVTLDGEHPTLEIDMLWMDTQGNERSVLCGASKLLTRTKAVHVEVQHGSPLYEAGSTFDQVDEILRSRYFVLYLIGIDPATGQGNAFYVASTELAHQ